MNLLSGTARREGMRFLLDECMPHVFATGLAERDYPDSFHPIHVGMRRAHDHVAVRRALAEDRTIISANAADFTKLLAGETIHPGLILLPNAEREQS